MLELAHRVGVRHLARDDDTATRLRQEWRGAGADAVVVCAATKSPDPVELAGVVARDRGVVVIVGDVPVVPHRATYYGKELSIRYSRSYGPGRYDNRYEEEGATYPEGYVPWPLRRNMEEFLRLVAHGLDLDSLSPVIYPVEEATSAFKLLEADGAQRRVAILLAYPPARESSPPPAIEPAVRLRSPSTAADGTIRVAAAGAGSFPTRMLFPHLKALRGVEFSWIATAGGVTARHQGARWDFEEAVASLEAGLERGGADCIMVLGPHAVHARHTAEILRRNVNVFCEKPLAITEEELDEVARAWLSSRASAMVGFNRRFAAAVRDLKNAMGARGPVQILYRVFAGHPRERHWSVDVRHGGRLVGEVCHFIDTAGYLIGSVPESVYASSADGCNDPAALHSASIHLQYRDGSTATVVYAGQTPPGIPKELIEVAGRDFAARIEDFRSLSTFSRGRPFVYRHRKGHREEMAALIALLRGEPCPEADFTMSLWSTLATCRAAQSIRLGRALPVAPQTPALARALGIEPTKSPAEITSPVAAGP
jgi:predicted dehydrogenase